MNICNGKCTGLYAKPFGSSGFLTLALCTPVIKRTSPFACIALRATLVFSHITGLSFHSAANALLPVINPPQKAMHHIIAM